MWQYVEAALDLRSMLAKPIYQTFCVLSSASTLCAQASIVVVFEQALQPSPYTI